MLQNNNFGYQFVGSGGYDSVVILTLFNLLSCSAREVFLFAEHIFVNILCEHRLKLDTLYTQELFWTELLFILIQCLQYMMIV